jgi:hypothetical protein
MPYLDGTHCMFSRGPQSTSSAHSRSIARRGRLQVIKDLEHLQGELAEPWGWRRVLRGAWGCTLLPFRLVCGCLQYVATWSFSTTAPQRRARRAFDKLRRADVEHGYTADKFPKASCWNACTQAAGRLKHRLWGKAQERIPPRLVVFVDDLDRIQPLKVAAILEAINIVLQTRRAWGPCAAQRCQWLECVKSV